MAVRQWVVRFRIEWLVTSNRTTSLPRCDLSNYTAELNLSCPSHWILFTTMIRTPVLLQAQNQCDSVPSRKPLTLVVIVIFAIMLGSTQAKCEQRNTPWRNLFNGKDLSGWQANTRPESYSVVDGVLKVHGKNGMSHLFYVGNDDVDDTFRDFELVAVVRSERNSNSGFFFHTDRELRKRKYLNKGYEVQLNSSKKEKRKTGSLYGIVDLPRSPVDETEWFEIRFVVNGNHIEVFVGGDQVIDYTQPESPKREPSRAKRLIDPKGGALAIQAHDPKSVFYFKSIRVRELD